MSLVPVFISPFLTQKHNSLVIFLSLFKPTSLGCLEIITCTVRVLDWQTASWLIHSSLRYFLCPSTWFSHLARSFKAMEGFTEISDGLFRLDQIIPKRIPNFLYIRSMQGSWLTDRSNFAGQRVMANPSKKPPGRILKESGEITYYRQGVAVRKGENVGCYI